MTQRCNSHVALIFNSMLKRIKAYAPCLLGKHSVHREPICLYPLLILAS